MNISRGFLSAVARWAQERAESLALSYRPTNQSALLPAWLDVLAALERGDSPIGAAMPHYSLLSSHFAIMTVSCYFLIALTVPIGFSLLLSLVCTRKCAKLASKAVTRHVLQGLLCVLVILNVYLMSCCLSSIYEQGSVAWGENLLRAVQNAGDSLHWFAREIASLQEEMKSAYVLFAEGRTAFTRESQNVAACMSNLTSVTAFHNDAFLPVLANLAHDVRALADAFKSFPIGESNASRLVFNFLRALHSQSDFWKLIAFVSMTVVILNASVTAAFSLTFCCSRRFCCVRKIERFMQDRDKLVFGIWAGLCFALAACVVLAIPSSLGLVAITELCQDWPLPSAAAAADEPKMATVDGIQVAIPVAFPSARLKSLHHMILNRLGTYEITFRVAETRSVSAIPTLRLCESQPLFSAAFNANASAVPSSVLEKIITNAACQSTTNDINGLHVALSPNFTTTLMYNLDGRAAFFREIGKVYFKKIENASCQSLNAAYATIFQSVCDGGRALSGYWFLAHLFAICSVPMIAISCCLMVNTVTPRNDEMLFHSFDVHKWVATGIAVDPTNQPKSEILAKRGTLKPVNTLVRRPVAPEVSNCHYQGILTPPQPQLQPQLQQQAATGYTSTLARTQTPVQMQMPAQVQPQAQAQAQAQPHTFTFYNELAIQEQGSFAAEDVESKHGSFYTEGFDNPPDMYNSFADDAGEEKAMDDCEYFSTQELVVDVDESPYIDARELEMMNQLKY